MNHCHETFCGDKWIISSEGKVSETVGSRKIDASGIRVWKGERHKVNAENNVKRSLLLMKGLAYKVSLNNGKC